MKEKRIQIIAIVVFVCIIIFSVVANFIFTNDEKKPTNNVSYTNTETTVTIPSITATKPTEEKKQNDKDKEKATENAVIQVAGGGNTPTVTAPSKPSHNNSDNSISVLEKSN